jgi:hypothetical protein
VSCLVLYRGKAEGLAVVAWFVGLLACGRGVAALLFVRVNQVLVRLWARVRVLGHGSGALPLASCMSDRMFRPLLGRGSSGWAARVQRRWKALLGVPAAVLRACSGGACCCVLSERPAGAVPSGDGFICGWFPCMVDDREYEKGIRWMPWHQEAMKDVARCEKPWGAASRR